MVDYSWSEESPGGLPKSSMRERLQPIFEAYRGHREVLIPVLQKAQAELGYLPEEAVSEIARFLGLSSSDI